MAIDSHSLAERISAETGLEFAGSEGADNNGEHWLELSPAGHPAGRTFTICTTVGWRRIDVVFRPGTFASDLIEAMGSVDEAGRRTFRAVLETCRNAGAEVFLVVNGVARNPDEATYWTSPWRGLGLEIRKGMLAINEGDTNADMRHVELWTSRMAAAVVALLPVEEAIEEAPELVGMPEGARTRIEVNRYERDRRNRVAALAIHGYSCMACNLDMEEKYGPIAAGMIEVHHVTPVSALGAGYIVDPATDLIPLCPNCHAVVHRHSPPLSLVALRKILNLA
ncbi:HNH endonuclease [Burkholderia ubonensis]|uniref:HNH endonuclease n=1 Tax=Burkholderia ubonensis TaxID=101571 RepID=UPI0009B35DD2|nr:HNH endonuclease [Burkholderia ubonensis]